VGGGVRGADVGECHKNNRLQRRREKAVLAAICI